MTAHATPAPSDPATDDVEQEALVLRELLGAGRHVIHMIETVAQRHAEPDAAAAPPTTAQAAQIAVAYDRAARAIRRTIMLQRRPNDPAPREQNRAAARRRIIRGVEDAIGREAKPADRDHLDAELDGRLDGPDLAEDIDTRPVPEIIAEICHDLGLAAPPGPRPWRRRTPADIADLCARAAEPYPYRPASPEDGTAKPERFFHLVPTPNRQT